MKHGKRAAILTALAASLLAAACSGHLPGPTAAPDDPGATCRAIAVDIVRTGDYLGGTLTRACFGTEDSPDVDALLAVSADYRFVGPLAQRVTLDDPRIDAIVRGD